jgi:hypothetical protein
VYIVQPLVAAAADQGIFMLSLFVLSIVSMIEDIQLERTAFPKDLSIWETLRDAGNFPLRGCQARALNPQSTIFERLRPSQWCNSPCSHDQGCPLTTNLKTRVQCDIATMPNGYPPAGMCSPSHVFLEPGWATSS